MDTQSARRLPPLNALRFFEAAGRLQSIRQAAAELYVTPGAVSRQIPWLGVPLFEHGARSVSLTSAGTRYLQEVTEHLGALAAATADVTGRDVGGSALLIRSYTLFATSWLVPRLTEFRRSEPWVDLQLVASSSPADFGHRDANAEIRPGPRQWPGYDADLLISDEIVLVGAPEYCARHRISGPRDLVRLGSAELLRSLASPRLWQGWLEMAGIPGLVPDCGPTYSDSVLTCRAAAAGQGVALAPRSLVESDLAAGVLTVPFTLKKDYQIYFYLVYGPGEQKSRAFRAFRGWLLTQTRSGRERSEAGTVSSSVLGAVC
jgi:LysR family transcriptional regulator, glycine cleavage system transcriptional activator